MGGHDHQKHRNSDAAKDQMPTAGPSQDDRGPFGDEDAERGARLQKGYDLHGRIIKVDVVGGRTTITVGLGEKQGVDFAMHGYVLGPSGQALEEFEVFNIQDRTCSGTVDLTVDQVEEHSQVVINPSNKP